MKNIGRIITIGLLAWTVSAGAQPVDKKTLTLADARQVIAAAVTEAKRLNAPGGVIAVVDDGGNLMALERLDGTFAAGANISIGKARTSALFKKPTKVFEDIIKNGRTAMVALPDHLFTPLQGGVPIVVDGQVVGAVGVSGGASAQQDEELAIAGARSLGKAGPGDPVTHLERGRVTAAFVRGAPLLENGNYKVHASRREAPGEAEVHEHETDVFYVLEGAATFVTGGSVVDPRIVAPGEIRGSAIRGGESRRLTAGDVVVIPRGVPHWFKESDNPFLYFVVKPIS
jgi:glc operon protein GlcG